MFLCACVFIFAGTVNADIGRVTESGGVATIKRGNATLPISAQTAIQINDEVITRSGRVRIKFNDDTLVTVTESSRLVIDYFVYSPSTTNKLSLKAAAGTVRYVSGAIAHSNPRGVKINTPTASIAVRGTDFIASVDETGSSMIILMPVCETDQNVNLKGLTCGSGRIDVTAGGTTVVLDRPYQATMIENGGAPPSPPVVVSLQGQSVGNNLLISPPRTSSGAVVTAARAAAVRTGDATVATGEVTESSSKNSAEVTETRETVMRTQDLRMSLESAGVTVTAVEENSYIYKIWRDSSQTIQTGIGYERLSPTGYNYAHIVVDTAARALLVVTQDRLTDAVALSSSDRPAGTIIINQSYR
jgi:tRNA pseudouridine-54 N-methylase